MKRIELACYALIASSFMLGGMILMQADRVAPNEAHADMVVTKDTRTMMSSSISRDRDIIYVLDSRSQLLLAYEMDTNKRTIVLRDRLDIAEIMSKAVKAGK